MTESLLHRARVVLVEPQDPVNIAGTVRAMKNMGVRELVLVRPVEYDPWRIEGVAHDTKDIVDAIVHADSLLEAVSDCVRVAAFTARARAAKRTVVRPAAAADALLAAATDGPVALVFGREDKGLPNDALDLAHELVTIPTTDHASLNLAQAVLVGLYEMHVRAGDATRTLKPPRKDAPPATQEQYERMFADAERTLVEIEFFKTRYSEHIMRSLRSLTYRAAPDSRELELVRAICI